MLTVKQIKLGATAATKADAIAQAGQLLVDAGVVEAPYLEGMQLREGTMSTYLENGVAIPHGTHDHIGYIKQTGISVVQIPDGVDWGEGDVAHLVIGIAANSDEHIGILSNLAEILEEEEDVQALITTDDSQFLLDQLTPESA